MFVFLCHNLEYVLTFTAIHQSIEVGKLFSISCHAAFMYRIHFIDWQAC